jgi:TolB protein
MKANGSDIRRLTYQGNYNTQPEWSPVEDVIVFTARDERSAFDIFLVDMEGNIKRLTQNQGNNQDPSFSPDGRYIIFQSDRRGGERMWLMTSDGEFQTPVSGSEVQYSAPVWKK